MVYCSKQGMPGEMKKDQREAMRGEKKGRFILAPALYRESDIAPIVYYCRSEFPLSRNNAVFDSSASLVGKR